MTDKKKNNTKGSRANRLIISYLCLVLVLAAAIVVINKVVLINSVIASESMETTLMTGDYVIGSRLAYRTGNTPERGDIVFFCKKDISDEILIKRVIALPGETVEIYDSSVFINGTLLEEDYLSYIPDYEEDYTFVVPENCYFVMGDNRNSSYDSRYWDDPYIELDEIIGKALVIYWPFSNISVIQTAG